jgi:hypothetical protein
MDFPARKSLSPASTESSGRLIVIIKLGWGGGEGENQIDPNRPNLLKL